MDRFVCVRLVKANGLDLSLLQFDYDLTFAVFFLNADRTIYGRYGTRSDHKEAERDISLDGFRETLEGVLKLHARYPENRQFLVGKQPEPPRYRTPDEYPALRGKYEEALDYQGNVVRSCLHCHQIREAERLEFRNAGQPIPDKVLFPWPLPSVIGLDLDPHTRATARRVTSGSLAEQAGLRAGDEIVTLNGQAVVSPADMQWVLHQAADQAEVPFVARRGERLVRGTLALPKGWRRGDISWRVTTWDLRRMATGGLKLEDATAQERRAAGLRDDQLALRVEHVGQYGEHAAAKRAGFRKDDLIVGVEGGDRPLSESELISFVLQQRGRGAKIPVTVRRGDRLLELNLPTQ